MHVHYANGLRHDGLILALVGTELRVAIHGADDPALFNLMDESWIAEDGRKVSFEFPLGIVASHEFLTAIQEVTVEGLSVPRSCESGGECLLKRMASSPDGLN